MMAVAKSMQIGMSRRNRLLHMLGRRFRLPKLEVCVS
jgi:hypothetical protein